MSAVIPAENALFASYYVAHRPYDAQFLYDWTTEAAMVQSVEKCFRVRDDDLIGGFALDKGAVCFPFLAADEGKRGEFWRIVIEHARGAGEELRFAGITEPDACALEALGAEVVRRKRAMLRPAEDLKPELPVGFVCRAPESADIANMAAALREGYRGGVDYEMFYAHRSDAQIEADIRLTLEFYRESGARNHSALVLDARAGEIAGVCLGGVSPVIPHGFSNVADIVVAPGFRGRGLGEFMLRRAITLAHGVAPAVRLSVTSGNRAEALYRRLGFVPAPALATLKLEGMMKRNELQL